MDRARRVALGLGVVLVATLAVVLADCRPDLSHLDSRLLSGPKEGNYNAIAARLAARAATRRGKLAVEITGGTVDNIEKLAAAAKTCTSHFAMVQDGVPVPKGVELIARLQKSESLVLLGKGAARFKRFADLQGATIGIVPGKSGTNPVMRELFGAGSLGSLGVKLSNHALDEQLALAEKGELDLAAMVIDEDAALLLDAVGKRGLELAPLQNLDVIARKYEHFWHGRIGAGQFDPVKLLPATDVRVLRVDTLIVGNGCASHAEVVGFLTLLNDELPGLIDHNRKRGGGKLTTSPSAKAFFDEGGAQIADVHVPWLVDILPPSQWIYIVTAISVLFNIMGFGHRFQLWRIDANRVRLDHAMREVLGKRLTDEETPDLVPTDEHRSPAVSKRLDQLLEELSALLDRCRRQSVSMLVPMGQEMAYRYQEDAIDGTISALRLLSSRLDDSDEA